MAENIKTNVMRLLEKDNIAFSAHFYSPDDGIDGMSVAKKLGQDPDSVFKTLVAQGKSRAYYVFVIPVTGKLSLRQAALASGEKSIEMIPQKLLLPTTGYIHGGCSPVGMKKAFPTYIDETAQLFDHICVSAGKIGCQVELSPDDLIRYCNATLFPLTEE
ncbi:MAG: Cys-tRNA(Pro) deacylase [Clostridia bacterium]|nr:Cys-tRNA(Pro) deacylase [Clostridia bacterium]